MCPRCLQEVSWRGTARDVDSVELTNDGDFSRGTTIRKWQLGDDSHSQAQLCLATTKFSVHLADAARLKTSTKNLVQLFAAGMNLEACLSFLKNLSTSQESRVRL